MRQEVLDASGISDAKKITSMVLELKNRALEFGPYTKEDYSIKNEEFAKCIQDIHTVHNAFGCAFTLTRDTLADKNTYFRFAMSRVSYGILTAMADISYKNSPIYKGVIPREEYMRWCVKLFGKEVIDSDDFTIVTSHYDIKPTIGDVVLELENNDARHRWEGLVQLSLMQLKGGIDVH